MLPSDIGIMFRRSSDTAMVVTLAAPKAAMRSNTRWGRTHAANSCTGNGPFALSAEGSKLIQCKAFHSSGKFLLTGGQDTMICLVSHADEI